MPPSRKPALLRGFAASSLAIFFALAGHVSAGGSMPGTLGIAVPWILSLMVCVLLAGRKLSVIRLSLSVAASQFLFHVLFVLGTITPSGNAAPHVHGAPLTLSVSGGFGAEVVADSTMWLGHALAALVTIAALYRGERMLVALRGVAVQLQEWLHRRLAAVLVLPRIFVTRLSSFFARVRRPQRRFLATLRGRAPPALAVV